MRIAFPANSKPTASFPQTRITSSSRMIEMTNVAGSNTDNDRLALLLISRLERLSADSYWAHQASGLRGSLLHSLERRTNNAHLSSMITRGFEILEKAAKEKTR